MALHEFMDQHREEILRDTKDRIALSTSKATDAELMESLPELYDYMVASLEEAIGRSRRDAGRLESEQSAMGHGKQRLHLGFTITELVHDYGALCEAITEAAKKQATIAPHEYQILNQMLDAAIAAAVTEYASLREREREQQSDRRATEHLGFITHELRNSVSTAMLAFDAIRRGQVAIGGLTSNVLQQSLMRLRTLLDRSLTEVRLKSGITLFQQPTRFRQLLEEVEAAATVESQLQASRIVVRADPDLMGMVDRQLMTSALANVLQNAIKYSPRGSEILLTCSATNGEVTIEIQDECGGLPEDKIEELFTPFVRAQAAGPGLGLGLAIARQAIEAHQGRIHVRNLPGKGCVFVMTLARTPLEEEYAER